MKDGSEGLAIFIWLVGHHGVRLSVLLLDHGKLDTRRGQGSLH